MEEKIKDVLDAYSFHVNRVSRGRGAYICDTNQGLKLVKVYQRSPQRLEFEQLVKYTIRDRGFYYVDQLNANKEGEYLTLNQDGFSYVVKDWYEGRECDVKNPADLLTAVRQLAHLHLMMKNVPGIEAHLSHFTFEDTQTIFIKRGRELKTINSYIRRKKQWNDFEKLLMKQYLEQMADVEQALNQLKAFPGGELYRDAVDGRMLCHGDFNYHQVIMNRQYTAVINFDRMHVDIQMRDLYQFLRKVMEKNMWDQKLGFLILDTYNSVRPLSPNERYYLYVMFLFPEKYWKIANRYYNSRKSWVSNVNYEKLCRLDKAKEARKCFIDAYKYCFIF